MTGDFNKTILAQNNLLVFRFLRLGAQKRDYYQVMVKDVNHNAHFFQMEENGGTWKIAHFEKKPCWICEMEAQLSEEISKQIHLEALGLMPR